MAEPLSAFSQSNRLLKLTLAPGSGIDDETLLPYELSGSEGISTGFTYTLVCLSSTAFLELKDLIGLPVQVAILTDDGTERALCGIVTAAAQAGSDGGFSRFVLTLQDPFAVLAKRVNSRVFQDLTVREFSDVVLQEHRKNNEVLAQCFDIQDRCHGTHPPQSWVTQYNESDSAFLTRWYAQEGISWYFEHGDDGVPGERPKLTLVLFDDSSVLAQSSAAKIRFHRDDGTESEDVITSWHGARTLQPGKTMRSSYEYKEVVVNTQQDENSIDQGQFGAQLAQTLEDNRFDTHHSANDSGDYARYGKLRIAAHEYAAKHFSGEGTHRELAVGRHFELTEHPVHDQDNPEQRQFAVTRLSLYARNNLPEQVQKDAPALLKPPDAAGSEWQIPDTLPPSEPVYRTRFDTVRKDIPIVPAFSDTKHAKPVAPALMTATVVGPPGEEINVNALGCIKIRMGFTRSQDHEHAEGAGATGTDRDSQWIRVAQPWTGAEYGHIWIPRVGDEVLIQFINGDIDRPIVTGTVYNGTHRPATHSHAGNLPGNKALSGIKSKMYKGSGANEIVWDDSTAEQRIRVATDHGSTALNLGYLVHPRVGGKGEPRGEGFEIRSDQYGVVRAAKGMLISTDGRENARGTHLDSKELTTQMQGSTEMAKTLSDAAKEHQADALDANEEIERLRKVAEKTYSQSGGTGQQATVPGYEEPILAFSSPAGIVSTTPKTHQIAAGEHLHLSSQQDTNVAIGKRLSMAIKEAWSVFVATSGIKLFAGKGKVQIQAQDDNLEATAKKDVKVFSIAGNIEIATPNELTLTAGGCQIKMAGGKIDIKAPGPVNIHGATKNLTGPAGGSYSGSLPAVPMKKGDMELKHMFQNGEPIAGAAYKAILPGGEVKSGVLDAAGKAILAGIPVGGAAVEYMVDPRNVEHKPEWEPKLPDVDLSDLEAAGTPNADAANATGMPGKAAALAKQAASVAPKIGEIVQSASNPAAMAQAAAASALQSLAPDAMTAAASAQTLSKTLKA